MARTTSRLSARRQGAAPAIQKTRKCRDRNTELTDPTSGKDGGSLASASQATSFRRRPAVGHQSRHRALSWNPNEPVFLGKGEHDAIDKLKQDVPGKLIIDSDHLKCTGILVGDPA